MKIAIDVSQVVYGTGVGNYTKKLVESLLKVDVENEYVLFGGALRKRKSLESFFSSLKGGNFESKITFLPPFALNILWNKMHVFPLERFVGEVDVYHSSDWTQGPSSAFKVTTVHDLAPIKFKKQTDPKIYSVHKKRLSWVKKEADRIIVPSNSTRIDLLKLGFDDSKIRVIHEAAVLGKASFKDVENVKKKYQTTDNYMVAIGVNERKNIKRIIDAFFMATAGKGHKLVIIGRPGIKIEERRGIRMVGHVSDAELSSLLTGAEALIYASLYEGFGQPILEGFACGTPVVTSDVSSMPEVAGKAAVLVDPFDTKSISEGIKSSQRRKVTLVREGKERLKRFSWEKAAGETLEVYKEAFT